MTQKISSAPETVLVAQGYKPCLGGCSIFTHSITGYCTECEPEEDVTKYDFGGLDDKARD